MADVFHSQPGPAGPTGPQGATGPQGTPGTPGTAVNPRGAYAGGTTYAQFDGVSFSSSNFISLVAGNLGHQPDISPGQWQSAVNTAFGQQSSPSGVNLVLTTTFQDFGGLSLTAAKTGTFLVHGVIDFSVTAGDEGNILAGQLLVNGVAQPTFVLYEAGSAISSGARATVSQNWMVTATGGQILKLQAKKFGGSGSSLAGGSHSTLLAVWLGY